MSRSVARHALHLAGGLAAATLAFAAAAQDAPDDPAARGSESAPPLWELGLFSFASYQAPYPGSDQPIAKAEVLPYGLYRGSVVRVADGGAGVRALKTPRVEWVVSATGAFGGSSNEVRAREGMPAIGWLVEAGPALKLNLGDLVDPAWEPRRTRLELPVRAVLDLSAGLRHRGWSFEPRLTHTAWRNETFALSFSGSLLVGDRALNRLFYGVDPAYATPDRPAYAARPGLIATRLGVNLGHRLTDTLRMHWYAQFESVRGAANEASPLVRAHEDGGVGVSLTWAFRRSDERGVD